MASKKRVLYVGESTALNTGYSVLGHELLRRIFSSGKYEVAEFGCYCPPGDPRLANIPWPYFNNMPGPGEDSNAYHANQENQFGAWRFNEVCHKFKCDTVLSLRDTWMDSFIAYSPLRKYYRHIYMPTVDAAPQANGWIDLFSKADAVLTYTDWACDVLREQGGDQINLVGAAHPAADYDVFKPCKDRDDLRRRLGMKEDWLVIGMASRNQKRKLFPDLLQAFASLLKQAPKLADRLYLYLHTSYPDVGWDIPRIIREEGLSSKVLLTYMCRGTQTERGCGSVVAMPYSDHRTWCPRCHRHTCFLPNSGFGIEKTALAAVYNTLDLYVQYCNSEGLGLTQVEAAGCGIPVFTVDYAGMKDVVKRAGATPIKVQRYYRESETHCWRALPDNQDFVDKAKKFLSLPREIRDEKGRETARLVRENFSYDRAAQTWMAVIDSLPPAKPWDSPPEYHQSNLACPEGLSHSDFVGWGLTNVAGRPDLALSYLATKMIRDLQWEATSMGTGHPIQAEYQGVQTPNRPYGRNEAVQQMLDLARERNEWEQRRISS